MEKKSQIYLSAFIMYLIAGLAGYINEFSNYWIVFILSLLITSYTLINVFLNEEDVKKDMAVEWISVSAFMVLELVLTVCITIIGVPFTGFFKYFNYSIQILGLMLAIYSVIRFSISYTGFIKDIADKIKNKKTNKPIKHEIVKVEEKEVAAKVEKTIVEETTIQDAKIDNDNSEETVSSNNEPEVIGIEYKEEKEIETPYMEEEI